MENIENSKFRKTFQDCLNTLIECYAISENDFMNMFLTISKFKIKEIVRLAYTEIYNESNLEDIADTAREIYFYYTSYRSKYEKKKKEKKYGSFTLRDSKDLIIFEKFLDKMLKLLSLSPLHFILIFPKCPIIFWDKIDDLRETSYKIERDSTKYTRCLRKCKTISFAFSNLSGINNTLYE